MPIALGSWWGFAIASLYALLILNRVTVEDRFLRANLPGYVECASRVRSRLVPGIW
jgi:protein-S-isoprenylcysteine O-methyltransferase Ste14